MFLDVAAIVAEQVMAPDQLKLSCNPLEKPVVPNAINVTDLTISLAVLRVNPR